MERNQKIILGFGIIICAILFLINIYLGAIGTVLLIVVAMSLFIMQDARELPEVRARLRDDAKGIVLENFGTAMAYKIHTSIVPLDIEFDLVSLAPDTKYESPLDSMINEAKAVVSFEDANGTRTTRAFALSALGKNDDDPLKPMFPLFPWKK